MSCACSGRLEGALMKARKQGERTRVILSRKLEDFREMIREGSLELIARHLCLAGLYFASLDEGFVPRPTPSSIMASLRRRVTSRGSPLLELVEKNSRAIMQQAGLINPEELLRSILRQRDRAAGLLEANGTRELMQAERVLERLDKLTHYLSSWREGIRPESSVNLIKIVDMHA